MKLAAIILPVVVSSSFASLAARAQESIDVAKITCDQYLGNEVIGPDKIAIWLSGYYNAKRGNTIVEVQEFQANVKKLEEYCFHHKQIRVMQAAEEALKLAKK
ncbi:MAG: HdeA/HdeB family chaperone [Rhodomicrobium sp.]